MQHLLDGVQPVPRAERADGAEERRAAGADHQGGEQQLVQEPGEGVHAAVQPAGGGRGAASGAGALPGGDADPEVHPRLPARTHDQQQGLRCAELAGSAGGGDAGAAGEQHSVGVSEVAGHPQVRGGRDPRGDGDDHAAGEVRGEDRAGGSREGRGRVRRGDQGDRGERLRERGAAQRPGGAGVVPAVR